MAQHCTSAMKKLRPQTSPTSADSQRHGLRQGCCQSSVGLPLHMHAHMQQTNSRCIAPSAGDCKQSHILSAYLTHRRSHAIDHDTPAPGRTSWKRPRSTQHRRKEPSALLPLLLVTCLLSTGVTVQSFAISPVTSHAPDSVARRSRSILLQASTVATADSTLLRGGSDTQKQQLKREEEQRRWSGLPFWKSQQRRQRTAGDAAATATVVAPEQQAVPSLSAVAPVRPRSEQRQQLKGSLVARYQQRKKQLEQIYLREEFDRRKAEWAARYTSVQGLREAFGKNRNILWGDLDATTTRRLYKTLLPAAIMELWIQLDGLVSPEEVAPLAYQARKAAKLYARERSQVPYRLMAQGMDGIRTFQEYGRFQPCGLSYQQIWDKYYRQVIDSLRSRSVADGEGASTDSDRLCGIDDDDPNCAHYIGAADDLTEEDVTAKICLKILEKSCATNAGVDKWLLSSNSSGTNEMGHPELEFITQQLREDVRKLLDTTAASRDRRRRQRRRRQKRLGGNNGVEKEDVQDVPVTVQITPTRSATITPRQHAMALQKYRTWRAIATTKRRIQSAYKYTTKQREGQRQSESVVETDDDDECSRQAQHVERSAPHRARSDRPWLNRPSKQRRD